MADIEKIQPMGDNTLYTLGARYLTHTPNNTTTFLRGDNTFTNTISNILYIYRETTNANILTDNGSAKLQFNVKATELSNTLGYSYIAAYLTPTATTYNDSLVIVSTGACLIGGGEGAETIHRAILTSGSGTENLYLCPDGDIHYYTGADSKTLRAVFNSSSLFYPATNNTGAIGTSSYKWANMYATTFHGALDGNAATATALTSNAGSSTGPIYFSGGKPVVCSYSLGANIKSYSGSLSSGGWNTMNGKGSSPSIAIAYNNSAASWNSGTYSASLVYGCGDTRGLLDCAYSTPIVTFGGCSFGGATNDNPTWYMKIKGTSGLTYTFPSSSKTLCATDGTGASGTWGINITGSAGSVAWGNVTGKPGSFTPASHSHSYLPLSGGTLSGFVSVNTTNSTEALVRALSNAGMIYLYSTASASGNRGIYGINASGSGQSMLAWNLSGAIYAGGALYGAVWNDYAEMRNVPEANEYDETENRNIKLAGRCVCEVGDDTMVLSTERMLPGCKIISDTFGFNIGETDNCKTPIAVSGRALVYIYEGRKAARYHIGQPVCSGPDGTVSIMTDEEYATKGYCCVGTISAVPEYETWGSGNVLVDGRIWIYVR